MPDPLTTVRQSAREADLSLFNADLALVPIEKRT